MGKKSLLEEVTELDKGGKRSLKGYLSSLKITSLETYNLGLSFEEHKHSSVNMKTAKVASEHTAEVTAVMGKDKIDS